MNELIRQRERLVTRSFYLAFEALFIFGVPALGAVYVGNQIVKVSGGGSSVVYGCLALAFVLSWMFFLYRVRSVSRKIHAIQAEIKEREADATQSL